MLYTNVIDFENTVTKMFDWLSVSFDKKRTEFSVLL
jgi:hypothetical protein